MKLAACRIVRPVSLYPVFQAFALFVNYDVGLKELRSRYDLIWHDIRTKYHEVHFVVLNVCNEI